MVPVILAVRKTVKSRPAWATPRDPDRKGERRGTRKEKKRHYNLQYNVAKPGRY